MGNPLSSTLYWRNLASLICISITWDINGAHTRHNQCKINASHKDLNNVCVIFLRDSQKTPLWVYERKVNRYGTSVIAGCSVLDESHSAGKLTSSCSHSHVFNYYTVLWYIFLFSLNTESGEGMGTRVIQTVQIQSCNSDISHFQWSCK